MWTKRKHKKGPTKTHVLIRPDIILIMKGGNEII